MTATNNVLAWYTTNSGGTYNKVQQSATSISGSGFSVTAQAENNKGYKGTAAHSVQYTTRGSWICGTTVEY